MRTWKLKINQTSFIVLAETYFTSQLRYHYDMDDYAVNFGELFLSSSRSS